MNRLVFSAATLACGVVLATVWSTSAFANRRVALVIGNSAYQNTPILLNPTKDAQAMAAKFKEAGFTVVSEHYDLGNLAFKRAIRDFEDAATDADVAIVFYSGHGIQIGGVNYMIPVDGRLASTRDAQDEAVPLDRLLEAVEGAKQLGLVILDASRDNPFVQTMQRPRTAAGAPAVNPGQRLVEPTRSNTLIAYAARAGTGATDGTGDHSPFTAALLNHLFVQGLDIRLAFGRVRDEVLKKTGNKQEPYVTGSIGGDSLSVVPASAQPRLARVDPQGEGERSDYELVEKIGTKRAWEVFLSQHPNGFYAELARQQLDKLKLATIDPIKLPSPPTPASEEQRAWDRIKDSGNGALLRDFIKRYPSSPLANAAQTRLDALEREAREREEKSRQKAAVEAARQRAEREAAFRPEEEKRRAQAASEAARQKAEREAALKREEERRAKAAEAAQQKVEQRETAPAAEPAQAAANTPIDRYPTIEADDRVAAASVTTVVVSLTVDKVTPQVKVLATGGGTTKTAEGALALPMPADRSRMPVKVVLRAAGFDLDPSTPEEATIELDRAGDSTSARFRIIARPDAVGICWLRVTFWRDNEFLANVSRKIEILPARSLAQSPAAERALPKASPPHARAGAPLSYATPPHADSSRLRLSADSQVPIALRPRPIDLKVEVVYDDPRQLGRGRVTIASDYLGNLRHGEVNHSPDLVGWLDAFYREFRAEPTVERVSGDAAADAAAWREARLGRMRAFGEELYRRAAPTMLKQAMAKLLADPSITLRTVQIYSNNPLVPWELMRAPKPEGGSTDFFGIAFALARGHEDDEQLTVRPLQDQRVDEVVAIAPAYGQQTALASPSQEIEQIRALLTTRQVAGRRSDFVSLVRQPPVGIVHFAGHGEMQGQTAVERRFAILLEDGMFDVMDWRGLPASVSRARALFFFNACDIGQAESIAGAVEGWGPAVLAKGASGYVGGLWPLSDAPASRFAVTFYQTISEHLEQNTPASVADALAQARRLVYETGDPTYLAYAFYGDAQLQFVRAKEP
jgi:Caspase domain/CHAT domain